MREGWREEKVKRESGKMKDGREEREGIAEGEREKKKDAGRRAKKGEKRKIG